MDEPSIERLEGDLLAHALKERHGYDFGGYSPESLLRRMKRGAEVFGVGHVADLVPLLLRDEEAAKRFVAGLSVGVTALFRDPSFFRALREHVHPYLETFPQVKVWHAGCATGEEVYSHAILLHEAGLHPRTVLYGTDISRPSIEVACAALYSAENLEKLEADYRDSGGSRQFGDYVTVAYGSLTVSSDVRSNASFFEHDLLADGSLGEMNVVICRNVLIYFTLQAQETVLEMLTASLRPGGFLCLGMTESLARSRLREAYRVVDRATRIFQRR